MFYVLLSGGDKKFLPEFLFIEKRVAEIYLDWYFRVVYLVRQTILHNLDIITSWLFPVPAAVMVLDIP